MQTHERWSGEDPHAHDNRSPFDETACDECGATFGDCAELGGCACDEQKWIDEVEAERAAFERVPSGLTPKEYVELAIQCLDQAGLPVDAQVAIRAFASKRRAA